MGIQINGNTDTISAIDGGLNVSGADFTGVSAGSTSAPSISPTGDSNTGIFFPSPDTVAIAEGGVEALRVDSNRRIIVAASTPLTTATAGAVEYDGKVVYSTPAGRGVSPSMMFYRLNTDLAGANVNTAQNLFGVGVTLEASTVYAFECRFALSKTAGTTSHSIGLGFGGTATLNNILYIGTWVSLTASLPQVSTTLNSLALNTASNTTINSAASTSSRLFFSSLSGTVSINAGGTFVPQYTLSAAPGGAYTTNAGSYFAIWPIGAAGSNTSVGPWA